MRTGPSAAARASRAASVGERGSADPAAHTLGCSSPLQVTPLPKSAPGGGGVRGIVGPCHPSPGTSTLLDLLGPDGLEVRERRARKRGIAKKDKMSSSPGTQTSREEAGGRGRLRSKTRPAGLLSMPVPGPPRVAPIPRSGFSRKPWGGEEDPGGGAAPPGTLD